MIGLSTLEDFVQNPPPFLRLLSTAPLMWDVNCTQVSICVDPRRNPYFRGALGNVFKFNVEDEFESLVKSVLSKPLILEVDFKVGSGCKTVVGHYFVTVNTANPVIKSQILNAVNEVRPRVMRRPVELKIDFNNVLDGWYRNLPGYPTTRCQVNGSTASCAEIVITSKPDVHPCFRTTVIGWGLIGATIMLSFLICCLTYYAVREIRTSTKRSKIQGDIKHLTWRNNVPVCSTDLGINFGEN